MSWPEEGLEHITLHITATCTTRLAAARVSTFDALRNGPSHGQLVNVRWMGKYHVGGQQVFLQIGGQQVRNKQLH